MNNINDNEIARAIGQVPSLQSKDAVANANAGGNAAGMDHNSAYHHMMPRRESIGVVNLLGDALFNRRTSLGFGGDFDMGFGGDRMLRRGSMDSVVDAAIKNLENRRLSMLGSSTNLENRRLSVLGSSTHPTSPMNNNTMGGGTGMSPLGSSAMGGGLGMMGMQSQSMNGGMGGTMGMNIKPNGSIGMSSQMNQFLMNGLGLNSMVANHALGNNNGNASKNDGAGSKSQSMDSSTSMRQRQLQEQRMELQRRQKELELQRQQLLSAMEERKQAMQQMQETLAIQQQQADRRHSLFGGALSNMPLPDDPSSAALLAAAERRGSFGGLDPARVLLEQEWRQKNGMRDERRGSLDLLGAIAGVTQEAEAQNNLMNKTSKPSQISSSNELVRGQSNEPSSVDAKNFTVIAEPIPLGLPADKDWLTPLHCFVRLHCVEVFTATRDDVAIPTKGKRKPIQVGQVGIRCPHCHNAENGALSRERGSVYYPTSVSSIYNATMNLLQRHLHNCTSVKPEIMKRYENLKSDDARSGTSKKYWAESALSLGLVDTPEGIRFSSSEPPPLPSLTSEQKASDNYSASRGNDDSFFNTASNALTTLGDRSDGSNNAVTGGENPTIGSNGAHSAENGQRDGSGESASHGAQDTEKSLANSAPLVNAEDEKVATQFSFYLLGQMQMCVFTEADRLGKRKGLPPGFPGLACRHCFGGYGSGRFFPSSIKTLSDTSKTLNVLFNHMMRCRKCPQEVRETLEKLRTVHDEQRAKMKFGSQKAFFARIWDRLHSNDPHVDSRKRKFNQPKKPKKPKVTAPTHAENLMNMQMGGAHLGQQSHQAYLNAANAFTGGLGGLSSAGFLNQFGVNGMLSGGNFNPPATQYELEATKRRKV